MEFDEKGPLLRGGDVIPEFKEAIDRTRVSGHSNNETLQSGTSCCGTQDSSLVWWNSTNITSIILSAIVLSSIIFTFGVMIFVVIQGEFTLYDAVIVCFFCFMSLWSHLMTMCSDPGAVPPNAHPLLRDIRSGVAISMCGTCDTFKPAGSHHDRISNRCISRMDHFCPWMNNAIGAKNQKNFILFLIYTDIACLYMLVLLAMHLVDCEAFSCKTFSNVALILVRMLLFLLIFGTLFTSSMLFNQLYGISTGLGTIDRMKKKKGLKKVGTRIPFNHVFGDNMFLYFLPLPPEFKNPEAVFGYRTVSASEDSSTI